ncbi:hypothetical protein F511_06983 [Dorcoceras hygrometricum]|uniref:Uncharacterized protein n=1 Tax=Dorcoceras hygrometricum TaxID=472368 RepID=A0A2Z7D8M2_9LAMI|nr:hypothetical protein F511_06983 [Dorcoceras hygrometricum]
MSMPKAVYRGSIRTSNQLKPQSDLTRARHQRPAQVCFLTDSQRSLTEAAGSPNLEAQILTGKTIDWNLRSYSNLQLLRSSSASQSTTPNWYQSKELRKMNPAPPILLQITAEIDGNLTEKGVPLTNAKRRQAISRSEADLTNAHPDLIKSVILKPHRFTSELTNRTSPNSSDLSARDLDCGNCSSEVKVMQASQLFVEMAQLMVPPEVDRVSSYMPPRRRGRATRKIPSESEAQNDEDIQRSIPARRRARQVDDEVDVLAARVNEMELIMARFQRMNPQTFDGDESTAIRCKYTTIATDLIQHNLIKTIQLRHEKRRPWINTTPPICWFQVSPAVPPPVVVPAPF